MTTKYCVRIASDDLLFSVSHFITYDKGNCERLHGHNYRLRAEVQGLLGEHGYVIDFVALRELLRRLIAPMDHRVLLPTNHPSIVVDVGATEIEVRCQQRRWVFPAEGCLQLPIANTTAELLAWYLGQQVLGELKNLGSTTIDLLRIEIEESQGVSAVCELSAPFDGVSPSRYDR